MTMALENIFNVSSYLLVTIILAYGIGFVCTRWLAKSWLLRYLERDPLAVFPLITSLGLSVMIAVLFFSSIFYVGVIVFWLVSVLGLGAFIAVFVDSVRKRTVRISIRWTKENVLRLAIMIATFFYAAFIAAAFKWPPAGDLISHGFYTSLIIDLGHIPQSFIPIVNLPFKYPPGLHVLAAFLSLGYGIYPGEALLILGVVFVFTLMLTIYELAYRVLRSLVLAATCYMSIFVFYPHMERWVLGYVFNGPYPNLFGFLTVATTVAFGAFMITENSEGEENTAAFLGVTMVLSIATVATYPVFVLVLLLVLLSFVLAKKVQFIDLLRTLFSDKNLVFLLAPSIAVTAYIVVYSILPDLSTGLVGSASSYYQIPLEFVTNSTNGYLLLGSYVMSLLMILVVFVRRLQPKGFQERPASTVGPLNIFNVIITTVCLASMNEQLYPRLVVFLPDRLVIVPIMFAWFLIVSNVTHLLRLTNGESSYSTTYEPTSYHPRQTRRKMLAVGILIAIGVSMFAPYLLDQITMSETARRAWHSNKEYFQDDFNSLEWINSEIPDDALILNDWAFTSLFIWSLSIKNISQHYILTMREDNRTARLFQVWFQPENQTYVQDVFVEYNVSFVFSSSEPGCFYHYMLGVAPGYRSKPFTPYVYKQVFSSYPFMEIVFSSGNSTVWRVLL